MSELAQVLNIDLHRAFIDASRVEEFAQHFSNVMATGTAVKEVLASAYVSAYGPDTRKWLKDNDVISKARELYIKQYYLNEYKPQDAWNKAKRLLGGTCVPEYRANIASFVSQDKPDEEEMAKYHRALTTTAQQQFRRIISEVEQYQKDKCDSEVILSNTKQVQLKKLES